MKQSPCTRQSSGYDSTSRAELDPSQRLASSTIQIGRRARESQVLETSCSLPRQSDKQTIATGHDRIETVGWHSSSWLGQHPALVLVSMSLTILVCSVTASEGVDCFKCSSRNGSNPACEDPFHNLNTTRITSPILPDVLPNVVYHTPCYAGRKGRDGLFLASTCIKLAGKFDTTGENLVVRHCALDSGTLTQDTELARMSHCGKFQFDGDSLEGCVLACPEDGCNSAPTAARLEKIYIITAATLASIFASRMHSMWSTIGIRY